MDNPALIDPDDIRRAAERIAPFVLRTPAHRSERLTELSGVESFLKMEQLQPTGSFKIRGATNKLLSLDRRCLDEGVVAASTGNHGAAVARAARALGGRAFVYVPENASTSKVESIAALGAEIRRIGHDGIDAEHAARQFAVDNELAYVSPYNDRAIIAGQGTVGLELASQIADLDAVYVAVGGGGLISGIATWLKGVNPSITVVACSPERSAVMHHSVAAGRILEMKSQETLSDGTAGGIEADAITFPICRELVDRWLLIPEDAIVDTLRLAIRRLHLVIEGSAAVAIGGLLMDAGPSGSRKSAAVVCGGNISRDTLRELAIGGL